LDFAIRTITTSLFILFFCLSISAQKLLINGDIKTDSGKGLQNCYVKIMSKTNHQVLAFSFIGKDTSFSIVVPFVQPDTFLISASHTGYRYTTIAHFINKPGTFSVDLVMPAAPDTLNNIILNSPPVWVNGDTTFFNANSFKQGDETRLKELITKMPGFEIDKQGNLLYKKQIVDKIMIDGEKIFADKVKLMLDNFPVYVLKNVQVIKNQTDDPLLKGLLNENKLFVNLSLTKNAKLKTAFGDGEAGVGTQNKYSINPVLFSLYGKLKIGYIGNWNNIGNGIGWKEQDELKSAPIRTAEQWMMASDPLVLVNDLENRRYISNGQSDNRFQINLPVSKVLKSTTEIDFIKDSQKQLTYNNMSLYNGTAFIKQIDTSYFHNKPYSFLLRESFNWNISSNKNVSAKFSIYHNGNNCYSNSEINQSGTESSVQNSLNNNWNSYLFSISYTHRVSAKKAVKWFADISQHLYPQKVKNISESWSSIFQLPDTGYNTMIQHLNNKTKMATLGFTSIINTKRGIFETGILLNTLSTSIETDLSLTNSKSSTSFYPKGFSNNGNYYTSSAIGYARKTINVFKLPFSVKGEYGFGTSGKSGISTIHYNHLLYSLAVNNQSKIGKSFLGKFDAFYSQHQLDANKLYSIFLPVSMNTFHRNLNVGIPLKTLDASYNIAFSWKPQLVLGLYADYNTNFSGWSSINDLYQFIQATSDSLTNKPLNNFSLHFNTNTFSFKNDFHFSTDLGYNKGQRFIENNNNLLKTNITLLYVSTTLSANWKKAYFISMDALYSNIGFKLPSLLQTQISQNVSDIKVSLSQRVAVNNHSSVTFNTDFFDKNIFTAHQLSFLIADVEYHYTISKSPLSFTFKLQNITNQTRYNYIDNSPLIQNFFAIPLIKRNIFLTVRYQL